LQAALYKFAVPGDNLPERSPRARSARDGCALMSENPKSSNLAARFVIGERNKKLNAAAIKLAKAIGPIHFSDGDKKCEPMTVLKHLRDYLRNKLPDTVSCGTTGNFLHQL
jgi:hypothetical protein